MSISSRDLKRIQTDLTSFDEVREKVFEASRTATRLSGWSIVQMHRNDMENAEKSLKEAKETLTRIRDLMKKRSELGHLGGVLVAYQEYVEAALLHGLLKERRVASLKEIGVESMPYILGALDLIGELRRVALNHLRRGNGNEADKTLKTMEELYENLMSLDHTAIVPTFRVKADATRRIIESTRGDVITEIRRMSLEESIRSLHNDIRKKGLSSPSI